VTTPNLELAEALPPSTATLIAGYVAGTTSHAGRKGRRLAGQAFTTRFGDLPGWRAEPVGIRMAAPVAVRGFAAFAAVTAGVRVDADYVVCSASKWGALLASKHPATVATFRAEAASLGFDPLEIDKMWSKLAQISVIAGTAPDLLSAEQYLTSRAAFHQAVCRRRGHPPKTLTTPLFGLDAVMFHRGQAPAPHARKQWMARSVHEVDWAHVAALAPTLAQTMRRYLDQLALSLRPSSVAVIDTTLRQLAGMLIADHPQVHGVADITRAHIEAFKAWLAARPGYRHQRSLSKTTLGMRMGHLRAFFERMPNGTTPTPHRGSRCSPPTGRSRTGRCLASSTTRPPPSCWPPPGPSQTPSTGSLSSCWPAPACARASCWGSPSTPWCRSAPPTGCAPRSASSTPTATSHCTHS
jgi:hypothetical protein